MNEEQDTPEGDEPRPATPKDEADGPAAGERLAVARREQKISLEEIAKELHLDETKLRALERNDFDVLGAPVFAKGHLRKYAECVGVDPDDVLTDYYQLTRASGIPPLIIERPRIRTEVSPGPWLAAMVILLAAAAAAYWWFAIRGTTFPASEPADAPAATEPETTVTQAPATAAGGERIVEPGSEPFLAQPSPAEPQGAESPATADTLSLTVRFSGDCWTEITDADGRRLFFNMARAGRTVELSGRAPIDVLFGNGENVSLQVNGSDYALQSNPANRTVRLTLTGSQAALP